MAATVERAGGIGSPPPARGDEPAGAPGRATPPAPTPAGLDRALLLRLAAFTALALYGALLWYALVEPTARGVGVLTVLATAGGAWLLARTPRPAGRPGRAGLLVVAAAAVLLLALVPAGVPLRLLLPDRWDELAIALTDGIATTPGIGVPYRGADAWVRIAILAGAGALLGLAALAAFWPRRDGRRGRPLLAAGVLGALYTVPIIEQSPDAPFLSGLGFALLAGAFLWVERLEPGRLGVGAGVVGAAAVLGLAVAPALDRNRPWFDYEEFAESLEPEDVAAYRWDHQYGPLDWPRDGRELMRIEAEGSAYWKATTLDTFDGITWRRSGTFARSEPEDTYTNRSRPEWRQRLVVNVRNLESRQVVGAGQTLFVREAPRGVTDSGQGSFIKTGRPLRRGSTYRAEVYYPRPSRGDLVSAGAADYDTEPSRYRAMQLPAELLRPGTTDAYGALVTEPVNFLFPAFGQDEGPTVIWGNRVASVDVAEQVLQESAYGRWWNLAQELKAEASGPFDFVRLVRDRVMEGAGYTEEPQSGRLPLDTFLFESRAGYCQHFSGAMALLLRMGGIPARVAAGFSPGSYDRARDEYVVRDVDAHSWVEAFLPGVGWYTADPTPGVAPARSQQFEDSDAANPNATQAPDLGGARDVPGDIAGGGVAETERTGPSPVEIVLLVLLAGGLVFLVVTVVRRGRLPGGPVAPELLELQRALHRSGRTPAAGTTLTGLERALREDPDAAAYLRAVRAVRYGGDPSAAPGREERRGLRRALAFGLGWRGRVRALWALPPKLPARPGRAR